MARSKRLVFAVCVLAATAITAPAAAVWDPNLGGTPKVGAPSEVTLSGLGPGHGVTGSIGPVGSVADPSVPYPATPPAGFTAQDEGFAGVILATPPGGGTALEMYCINIRTPTNIGFGYDLGQWDQANVSNVGYVARLLNDYFPNTALPAIGSAGIANTSDQGAAVQAAIWYFADNYTLNGGVCPSDEP